MYSVHVLHEWQMYIASAFKGDLDKMAVLCCCLSLRSDKEHPK